MTRYLLDSDCVIEHLRGRPSSGTLLQRLYAQGDDLFVSDVVLAEVYSGLREGDRPAATALLSNLGYLPTTRRAAVKAGEWRYRYARLGQALATTDCLIAATAADQSATLVTGNSCDFPMPELAIFPLR